ncbi:MAG: tRNA pseudouridine(38-40) synthase TruA [Rectinemataceae bacterium]|jgi:tRNA pseudouridine38-40 synthase
MARRNFLIRLAYDGTDFLGWQRLPDAGRSVQAEVEAGLTRTVDAAIEVVGAGRTDAGVHAEGQAASFHAFTVLGCAALKDALNAAFPPDLACRDCVEVDSRFHARLHAKAKVYRYRLLASREGDPFLRRYSLHVPEKLDLGAMSAAAAALVGERDFRAVSNAKGEDTVRRVEEARVEASGRIVDLVFVGPGFIYNQVRVMAALLLEAGKGVIAPERVPAILAGRDRAAAPGALGPYGLCLVEVRYDRG